MSETKKPGATFILTVGPVHPVKPKDRPPVLNYRMKVIEPDGRHLEWEYDTDTDLQRILRSFGYAIVKWQGQHSQFGQHMTAHDRLVAQEVRAIMEKQGR